MKTRNRPIFIRDQNMQLLVGEQIDLNYHLHPGRFRGSADKVVQFGPAAEATGTEACWVPLTQALPADPTTTPTAADALLYRLDPYLAATDGVHVADTERLHRTVLIADSGYGKTVRLRWIRTELSRRHSRLIPFLLNVDQLPGPDTQLLQLLHQQLTETEGHGDLRTLERWRKSGRILLLLDAADQIRQLQTLRQLLKHKQWQQCPIVVSGRPEVIHTHRDIFPPEFGFQYVRPMELTDEQVQRYMGPERYSQLEHLEDAREILRNPRVAWYLGYVIDSRQLKLLKSASDVFESATTHLLQDGLKNKEAWRLGLVTSLGAAMAVAEPPQGYQPQPDSQIERAHRLLSAIAFEQMLLPPEDSAADSDLPNFSGVNPDEQLPFLTRVFNRVRKHDPRYSGESDGRDLFNFDLQCLSEANVAITRGLLDVGIKLREIRWRNKSLQEFYAARWLSNHATDDDLRYLTDRRYHPLTKDTFWFYWVERYLCEMPKRAGEQQRWAHAVEPFFRPGDGTATGTRRSCEMIHRAWPRLQQFAKRRGSHEETVRNAFLGEFEDWIVSGKRDATADLSQPGALKPSDAAKELKATFVDIPAGCFRMGAPDEKQGMGAELRKNWQDFIERFRREESLDAFLENRLRPYKERSRTDAQLIQYMRQQFTRVFKEGVQVLENWWFPHDETPETDSSELELEAFQLSRYPVLNRWYRLFDPGHGTTGSPYDDYAAISGTEDRPLIYADWYMSWCFALFCHWDGQSCELPGEDQWEYAAKAERTVVEWPKDYKDFWWGDNFEQGRHHCTFHAKRTTPPADFTKAKAGEKHHENPFGLVDMLGNVWEWTRDRYRRRYSRTDGEGKSSAFVLRGGSWSVNDASNLRCGRRSVNLPTYSYFHAGCRLSRVARARKP